MENQIPIPIVRIFLYDKSGRILFIRRQNTKYDSGKFSLPGGKIDFGEKMEEACARETKEETNIDIENPRFLFFDEYIPKDRKEMHFIIFYFYADFKAGEIKLNEESSEYKWIAFEDIKKDEIAFNQFWAVEKFVSMQI